MASHDETDFWHDADHRYFERRNPRRRRIDPFFARVFLLGAAGALLIPVALTLRPDRDTSVLRTGPNGGGAVAIPGGSHADSTTTTEGLILPEAFVVESTTARTSAPSTDAAATTVPTTAAKAATTTKAPATTPATVATTAAAPVTAPAPACGATYRVVSGDSWYGIAQRAGVSLQTLLAANEATSTTRIFPGMEICLPVGAKAIAPATTAKAPTAAPTTAKPVVTAAPTTAAPAPSNSYSRDEVIAIIRSVWPDELEDKAIAVAIRESTLNPTVRNYCCYGLFQIYFSVHKSWLAAHGVTTASQLYDPVLNTNMAYVLYQRSGGWGPWGG